MSSSLNGAYYSMVNLGPAPTPEEMRQANLEIEEARKRYSKRLRDVLILVVFIVVVAGGALAFTLLKELSQLPSFR